MKSFRLDQPYRGLPYHFPEGATFLPGLWAVPISGVSMNPVRSFAPDLVRGDLNTTWIYIIGPILGALIGVAFEWILKGKPTVAGTISAQGSLDIDDSENVTGSNSKVRRPVDHGVCDFYCFKDVVILSLANLANRGRRT